VTDPETSQWRWLLTVFGKSLYFSTVTFATLGFGDIQPFTGFARAIAGIEALLGQLLMALLVFVLTRNVTWTE
jgi:voltage-gated potassium channel Kch